MKHDGTTHDDFPGHTKTRKAHNHAEIWYTYTHNIRDSPALLPTAGGAVRRRRRSPDMGTVRIPLFSRKHPNLFTLIDEQDAELVSQYRWYPRVRPGRSTTYAAATNESRRLLMHRVIVGAESGEQVDHIDGDGLNNTRSNLRIASNADNLANMKLSRANTSGFKGVSLFKGTGRWAAKIGHNGGHVHLGCFTTAEEAARAYDDAAVERFGQFALTNEALGLLPPERTEQKWDVVYGPSTKGVSWKPSAGKWTVRVRHQGRDYFGGNFSDYSDAVRAMLDLRFELAQGRTS